MEGSNLQAVLGWCAQHTPRGGSSTWTPPQCESTSALSTRLEKGSGAWFWPPLFQRPQRGHLIWENILSNYILFPSPHPYPKAQHKRVPAFPDLDQPWYLFCVFFPQVKPREVFFISFLFFSIQKEKRWAESRRILLWCQGSAFLIAQPGKVGEKLLKLIIGKNRAFDCMTVCVCACVWESEERKNIRPSSSMIHKWIALVLSYFFIESKAFKFISFSFDIGCTIAWWQLQENLTVIIKCLSSLYGLQTNGGNYLVSWSNVRQEFGTCRPGWICSWG